MTLLTLDDVMVRYGPTEAVRGVSFALPAGRCTAILGANGAGKTSLLKAITRLVPSTGRIRVDGNELPRTVDKVVQLGIGHVLEGRHVFTQLTVEENLKVGLAARRKRPGPTLDAVLDAFAVLRRKYHAHGGELSGGEQQTVAIARSLLAGPRLLLMDEPSLGLAPRVMEDLALAINRIRKDMGLTVLIAEQSLPLAYEVAEEFVILRNGKTSFVGQADESQLWSEVHKAYFGSDE